jgi:hypothetical protein
MKLTPEQITELKRLGELAPESLLSALIANTEEAQSQLASSRREAAEAQARLKLLDKQYTRMQLCFNYPRTHEEERAIFIRALRPQKCDESALQSAIEQAVAPYREQVVLLTEQVRALSEAAELALSSHGALLMSDPPQDAWKVRGVDAKLRAALATVNGEA